MFIANRDHKTVKAIGLKLVTQGRKTGFIK
jgi:hypothetical protein